MCASSPGMDVSDWVRAVTIQSGHVGVYLGRHGCLPGFVLYQDMVMPVKRRAWHMRLAEIPTTG